MVLLGIVPVLVQTPPTPLLFDDGHSLSRLGGLDGGALAARTRANDDEVVGLHGESCVMDSSEGGGGVRLHARLEV